jgi:mercuric ion binding protein
MNPTIPTLAMVAAFMAATPATAAERTVTLHVDNMYCDLCPATVKKSLTRVPGVHKAVVSFEKKSAVITFDDSKAQVSSLIDATTKAGYPSQVVR